MRKVKSVAKYYVLIALPPKGRFTLPSKGRIALPSKGRITLPSKERIAIRPYD